MQSTENEINEDNHSNEDNKNRQTYCFVSRQRQIERNMNACTWSYTDQQTNQPTGIEHFHQHSRIIIIITIITVYYYYTIHPYALVPQPQLSLSCHTPSYPPVCTQMPTQHVQHTHVHFTPSTHHPPLNVPTTQPDLPKHPSVCPLPTHHQIPVLQQQVLVMK